MEDRRASYTYPYAIDENGNPISIDNITKESRHDCRYFCYGCGAELFPVLGDVREHHFRHEKGSICDPNKYLHEFAKGKIKERFDSKDSFVVQYHARQKCKLAYNCKLYQQFAWPECEHEGLYEIDLKKFYDTCTAEKGYYQILPDGKKKYIADLILTNSQKPDQQTTSIEIWVTHECTEDKKQNGGRIIEIRISCEKDADRSIVENNDELLPVRFFNFKNPVDIEPCRNFKHIKIMPGLRGMVVVTDETPCYEGVQFDPKGKNEVILSTADLNSRDMELLYAIKCNDREYLYPHRILCEYGHIFHKNIRCQYLTRFNPHCPCDKFKYSKQKGEIILNKFKNIQIWETK